jgi:hypothetical protein
MKRKTHTVLHAADKAEWGVGWLPAYTLAAAMGVDMLTAVKNYVSSFPIIVCGISPTLHTRRSLLCYVFYV